MQPVIPLQPYIAQGEGSGSAFILPRQQRQSAIDVLAQDYRVKKAEEQARNKAFQDELVALEGLGKGLLPSDEKRIRDEYQKHLEWVGQQGLSGGMNPANPSSPNYLENKKRMNQISSLANIGKYRKELLTDLQKKALTGEYDEESLRQQREYITNTPIEEFDVNKVGQIEKRFDPNEYLNKSLQGVKVEEETKIENVRPLMNEKGQRVLGQNIGDEVTAPKEGEIDKLAVRLTTDTSYNGKRYKDYLTEQYFSLPEDQQQAVVQRVIKKNASAKDNKDLLQQGIILEMSKDALKQRFEVKRSNKLIGEDQPREGANINIGGGYNVNGAVFNPTLADPANSFELYQKAGVVDQDFIKAAKTLSKTNPEAYEKRLESIRNNVGDLLSISGPNKGGYSLYDEGGKKVYLDNVDFVYVPKVKDGKGGQWYVKGVERIGQGGTNIEKTKYIPVNEKTYGNIISIYPKMTSKDVEVLFNQRMKDGGVTNDEFRLQTNKVQPKKQSGQATKTKKVDLSAFDKTKK